MEATEDAAKRLHITVASFEVGNITDLESAFTSIRKGANDGMIVFTDGLTYARRQDIIDFAAGERLPTMYDNREFVAEGVLISYAASLLRSTCDLATSCQFCR